MTDLLTPSESTPAAAAARRPDVIADRAARLVAASERLSYDPFTDVDWSVPIDDHAFHLPPEFLPLYGTPVWDAMTDEERRTYSRHECAALCAAGIWFENILMHLVLQHLYGLPADDPSHRYLLVETADECRHSTMFGEYIRRAGTPAYPVRPFLRALGAFMKATTRGPEAYIAMLAAEEILDVSNRATMRDERVHATSRRMAKIHVAEEARHVSFARTYVAEVWPDLNAVQRVLASIRIPFVVAGVTDALVNPAVYRQLGIDGGTRLARRNPHHRQRVQRDLSKLTGFLSEVGVINRFTRPVWRVLGLMAT